MADGIFFVNCTKGNEQRSGIAYYSKFSQAPDGNDGQQPDAFVYTAFNGFTHWEGSSQFAFADGVRVSWEIQADGGRKPQETVVGGANNTFHSWVVKKDKERFMFRNGDGFDCSKIYYAA